MQAYKMVYKMENGQLIQNKENKIEYVQNGTKRTKTNPTLKDFAKVGMHPKKYNGDIPDYDFTTQELKEHIELKDNTWEISYIVVNKSGQPSAVSGQ